MAAAAASGNQPPSSTFTRFAPKNEASTTRKSTVRGCAFQRGQRHRSRMTRWKRSVVMIIVPVTAMPYAAASAKDDLKPRTSAGIAVTGTMMVTTLLFHRVARDQWRWPRWVATPLTLLFLLVDASFFLANVVKVEEGGWFPLAAAALVFTLFSTWKKGRAILAEQMRGAGLPLDLFLGEIARKNPQRVAGTAVFMTGNVGNVPPVLLHHLKHNKVLHERVVLVSLITEEIPSVPEAERVTSRELGSGFYQVVARYGFMETPDVPALLESLPHRPGPGPKLRLVPMETTYFLGRETLLPTGSARMATWRKKLFIVMARNAQTASSFFGLPPNRVVEMGAQIQL